MDGVGSPGESEGAPTTQRPVLLREAEERASSVGFGIWTSGLARSWACQLAQGLRHWAVRVPICRVLSGSAVGEGPSDSRWGPRGH